jgi:hypothetical protein
VSRAGGVGEELCVEFVVLLCEFEGRGEVLWWRVLDCISVEESADGVAPGTKPILSGAMIALVVESWRVWWSSEVGWATRRVRSIECSM